MNPVNATALYVSVSRSVLQCDPRDPRALAELCKLLPFFRQSLSCLVCGNLLQDPIAPTDSSCQHYVCRGCKGQRMQLKPSCSWCKDYSRFEENRQLSLLVHCYRKLCLYITQSPLATHIATAAGDSPDLQAVLNEGLTQAESEPEAEDVSDSAAPSQTASTSDVVDVPLVTEIKGEELSPVSINGLHDCNGLVSSDSLQPVAMDTGGGISKQESFSAEIPVCVSVTASEEAGLCDISTFGDELKHGGGPLLLSVEEVLRTLDTDPDPSPEPDGPPSAPQSTLNGPLCPSGPDSSRLIPSLPPENSPHPLHSHPQPSLQPPPQPSPAVPCLPPRCRRKRSRSESDSEKVQPLPISSLLQVAPLGPSSPAHHYHNPAATNATKQEPQFPVAPPHPHLAPVPNGSPAKVGKAVLVSNKALKKTVEHHSAAKKAYTKARQGAPNKPRPQPRDRVPPHPHAHPLTHPPSPSKPLYKKPVEKKGCKCGRATQNPSVLTCRGQRCPCYSNRKACLDCICRGCQNSYMANGEKKLEAFAVPEKALEQTRLTLGINLTSITAAALRSPAASSPGGTLLNVTTATGAPVTAAFLSGAGHDSRAFDDSLEMRFDC
ncbi:E3 ubiquitin-protein ligase MSL2-like [Solea solea]|uniref:E3 ubiquitin-protein ligase MSL2-like n=1 Tax=Solea solea TaxID=90069 RepID=UPI00272990A2|nr:E3 ubiquitin-protein ligase MSL2-like [Solea solea]